MICGGSCLRIDSEMNDIGKKIKYSVNIELDSEEALVLFDFLTRLGELDDQNDSKFSDIIEDEVEKTILWNMLCQLESRLIEPCDPNYRNLVEQARKSVKGGSSDESF